jgi:hypothetical protein
MVEIPTQPETSAARTAAAHALIAATIAIAEAGTPLMLRVVPDDDSFTTWDHYPPDDAVDATSGARWFYHAHAAGEREGGEHGHFHLFLDRSCFADAPEPIAGPPAGASSGADVVHIVAIAIDLNGLPTKLFTANRWVTDEWLYDAAAIRERLAQFDLAGATGDPLVNAWLTAAVAFFAPEIETALQARDREIGRWAGTEDPFEDRGREIISSIPVDINAAVGAAAA